MNIGAGLAAANSFITDQRETKKDAEDRAFLAKQRDYQLQLNQSGLDTLPDETAARKMRAQRASLDDQASMRLAPQREAVDAGKLGLENLNLTAAAERAPTENATRNVQAETGLGAAKFSAAQQGTEQSIAAKSNQVRDALANYSVEELPQVIAQKKRAGIFNEVDAGNLAIAKLADLIQVGDANATIKFMNDMSAASPTVAGKQVAKVGITKDANGENIFVATDAEGQPVMQLSAKHMTAIRDSIGKTDLKEVSAGASLVGVKGGRASVLYEAPQKAGTTNQHTPADVQMADWMVKNGVAKDPNEAWTKVRSAREKTEASFVGDMMKEAAKIQSDPVELQKLETTYRSMYARLHAGSPGLNTPAAPTLNPQIKSLLGIP
jgi:hypothetical protein